MRPAKNLSGMAPERSSLELRSSSWRWRRVANAGGRGPESEFKLRSRYWSAGSDASAAEMVPASARS